MELSPHTDEIILLAQIIIEGAFCHVTEPSYDLGRPNDNNPHGLTYQSRCELSYAGTGLHKRTPCEKQWVVKLIISPSTMGFVMYHAAAKIGFKSVDLSYAD
jgi:hypothetical protein